jgi:malonate decarboxylase beta subunit
VTGGKHRYLTGDCNNLVEDDIEDFRQGIVELLDGFQENGPSLDSLRAEQERLTSRKRQFDGLRDGLEVWKALGVAQPEAIPLMDREHFIELAKGVRA